MFHSIINRSLLVGLLSLAVFGAKATDYIENENELREIACQGGSVSITADIVLSRCLEIPEGKELTLYITDRTLSRSLLFADENGYVIRNYGKLTIQGNGHGTITGGWATIGGGIYNATGATLVLNDIVISGNKASERGGGIANYGNMTVSGCTLTDNQAKYGAGIAMEGGYAYFTGENTITQNTAANDGGAICFSAGTVGLQDKPVFWDNTASDVFLAQGTYFTLTGELVAGAHIGVNPAADGTIAITYKNDETPGTFFESSNNEADIALTDGNVTYTTTAISYLSRQAGSTTTGVIEEELKVPANCEVLTSSSSDKLLSGSNGEEGWYIVKDDITLPMLTIGSTVNLIILNGKTLTCTKGIYLTSGNELHIYSQTGDGGTLRVTADGDDCAGIGCRNEGQTAGTLYIHGGQVYATGSKYGAGIGGGFSSSGGEVNIYGGTVIARSKGGGAGIGGGKNANNRGTINIFGGTVEAYGFSSDNDKEYGGAGIGGGYAGSQEAAITIHGGIVRAYGGPCAAGIGGGRYGSGGAAGSTVIVNGGDVYAYGGEIYAGASNSGAGIGGGRSGKGGDFHLNGGSVQVYGGVNAPAIGNGSSYEGSEKGSVEINGGKLIAIAPTTDVRALGYGTLSIGNWENNFTFYIGNREDNSTRLTFHDPEQKSDYVLSHEDVISLLTGDGCSYVRIESCDHTNKLISSRTAASHTYHCQYCYLDPTDEEHTLVNGKCTFCGTYVMQDAADNSFNVTYGAGDADYAILAGRTLYKDGSWNTLCLPFAISDVSGTVLEGATIMTLDDASFDRGTLSLSFANAENGIEAGKPYLVKWETTGDNIIDPQFRDVTITDTKSNVETGDVHFLGTYAPVAFTEADPTVLYLGAGNKLYYPKEAMTIGAQRAYFELQGGLTAGEPTGGSDDDSQLVRAFHLDFGDETSVITQVNSDSSAPCFFTLDGRRLARRPTQKGIYIRQGAKVVIE